MNTLIRYPWMFIPGQFHAELQIVNARENLRVGHVAAVELQLDSHGEGFLFRADFGYPNWNHFNPCVGGGLLPELRKKRYVVLSIGNGLAGGIDKCGRNNAVFGQLKRGQGRPSTRGPTRLKNR